MDRKSTIPERNNLNSQTLQESVKKIDIFFIGLYVQFYQFETSPKIVHLQLILFTHVKQYSLRLLKKIMSPEIKVVLNADTFSEIYKRFYWQTLKIKTWESLFFITKIQKFYTMWRVSNHSTERVIYAFVFQNIVDRTFSF